LIRGGVESHTCQVSNLENLQDKTFKCVVRWELIPILLKLLGVPELDGMWYAHYPKVKKEKYCNATDVQKGVLCLCCHILFRWMWVLYMQLRIWQWKQVS
jgi:hypothetical protein